MLNVGNALLSVGGDVVIGFEGESVESSDGFTRMILRHRPGKRVELRVLREGRFMEVPMVLGERPRRQ